MLCIQPILLQLRQCSLLHLAVLELIDQILRIQVVYLREWIVDFIKNNWALKLKSPFLTRSLLSLILKMFTIDRSEIIHHYLGLVIGYPLELPVEKISMVHRHKMVEGIICSIPISRGQIVYLSNQLLFLGLVLLIVSVVHHFYEVVVYLIEIVFDGLAAGVVTVLAPFIRVVINFVDVGSNLDPVWYFINLFLVVFSAH